MDSEKGRPWDTDSVSRRCSGCKNGGRAWRGRFRFWEPGLGGNMDWDWWGSSFSHTGNFWSPSWVAPCSYSNSSQELFWSPWHSNAAKAWTVWDTPPNLALREGTPHYMLLYARSINNKKISWQMISSYLLSLEEYRLCFQFLILIIIWEKTTFGMFNFHHVFACIASCEIFDS